MITEEQVKQFEGWCIVELMGHNVIAGFCSEQVIAGTALLRVDVPHLDGNGDGFAFTKYFASSAIYGITPTTEEAARVAAGRIRARPVSLYILPDAPARPMLQDSEYDHAWEGDDEDSDE